MQATKHSIVEDDKAVAVSDEAVTSSEGGEAFLRSGRRDMARRRLLSHVPKGGVCAEVGVWEGNFSEVILEICEPKKLHLIDPWLYMPEFSNTGFGRKKNALLMEQRYHDVCAKFKDDPRVEVHRATSEEALGAFEDGSLDWVYLDGNHNAPFIDNDLEMSLKKVKAKGLILGDDYNWMAEELGAPVKQAVTKVMEALGRSAKLRLIANQYMIQLDR